MQKTMRSSKAIATTTSHTITLSPGTSPAGGNAPRFLFLTPNLFLAHHGIFLGGKSCCFWAKKTFKFVISARKSLRILAKIFFFWRSPVFSQKKPSNFGEDLFFLFFLEITRFSLKIRLNPVQVQ